MNRSGSLAYRPPPSDAERKRIQELSRYYCTLDRPECGNSTSDAQSRPKHEAPKGDEQPTAASLSPDITLTALAQLGVLRLGCNRSFVSIIDGDNQHIIAEATGSISIRDVDRHLPEDGIYLGARTLDLVWGVCPHTIGLFTGQDLSSVIDTPNVTANRTRYIIRDFTKEDCFKDRPYVREWPYMRFYAEVPLYSPSGHVLGSYCVVDNKPRGDFGDADVETLQEVSDAIGRHLENTRIVHYHTRAERLVRGLTGFVKDYADFDPREASSNHLIQATTEAANAGELSATSYNGDIPTSVSTSPSETPSPLFFCGPATGSTDLSSVNSAQSENPAPSPGEEKSLSEVLHSNVVPSVSMTHNPSTVSLPESIPLATRVETIFARASLLLKESMKLGGVLFLDATRTNPSFLPPRQQDGWEPLPKSASPATSSFPAVPLPSPLGPLNSATSEPDASCQILASSLKKTDGQGGEANSNPRVPEQLLDTLVTHYPQGQIFDLSDVDCSEGYWAEGAGAIDSRSCSNVDHIPTILASILPGATSALFFPLWDYHKSRWMAGTLVWTHDTHRPLELEELHYFKVFGDSIVSEIARARWSTTEKSKFDFISSVSHELRSPLHGILASAELLHSTPLQPGQEEMVKMIESSGLTLLDTTDHLLDFCKINNLTQTTKLRRKRNQAKPTSLVSEFDLGQLIEEVSDILYTGQRVHSFSPAVDDEPSQQPQEDDSSEVSVIVRVEQNHHWNIRSQAGAWRRIVMNLLGNSMKWTKKGFVEVSLARASSQSDPNSLIAQLTLTDTGSGIAPDFLRYKLFSPFTQEDSLAEGVGLGLSIVRLLVASLGGHVNVKSELGIGTQVDVLIPVQSVDPPADKGIPTSPEIPSDPLSRHHACLVAFNGYPDLKETPTGLLSSEAKRKLSIQSTLADIFMARFGWSVSLAESLSKVQGNVDVAVIEESALQTNAIDRLSLDEIASKYGVKFFIILGDKVSIFEDAVGSNLARVSQPFGPMKFEKAVQRALDFFENPPPVPPSPPSAPVMPEAPEPSPPSADPSSEEDDDSTPKASIEVMAISPAPVLTPPSPPPETHTHNVLVVDDNTINLKIMATFMRKIGCNYDTASNGLIALEKYMASERPYDYVLMDISMPVMDGLVSTSKIRQYEKEKGLNPACIMAVTGVASDSMHQQALTAGVNDYLIKPLSLHELRRIMGSA